MVIKARENLIGAWAFLIGVVLAIFAGLLSIFQQSAFIQAVLAVLGVIVGYFVAEKDVQTFLLASVSLVLASFAGINGLVLNAAINGISIGGIVSSILGSLLALFVPATVIVALKTVFSIAQS